METIKRVSHRLTLYIVFIFSISTITTGCKTSKENSKPESETKAHNPKNIFVTVVDMRRLDGCGFVFRKEDETLLIPVNMPDSLNIINLKLYVNCTEVKRMSTCMAGKLVEIKYAEYAH